MMPVREGDVSIVANPAHEEMNAAIGFYFRFITLTFRYQIQGIAIQQIDVFMANINVVEEIFEHEAVIALRMVLG